MKEELAELLAGFNRTELLQLAQRRGLSPHPSVNTAHLTDMLLEDFPTPDSNPVDGYRYGLMGFIEEYWTKLQPQLKCPAKNLKSGNPRPCFGCADMQVIRCVVDNKSVESKIRFHMKKPE
jgi:hypothetical protein